ISNSSPDTDYKKFLTRNELEKRQTSNDRPLLENNRFRIIFYVRIADDPTGVLWHDYRGYSSLKQTGYIGLATLDACRYLNPLLEVLLHIKPLRDAVGKAGGAEFDTQHMLTLALSEIFTNIRSGMPPISAIKVLNTLEALGIKPPENTELDSFTGQILQNITSSLQTIVPESNIDSLIGGKIRKTSQRLQASKSSSSIFKHFRGPDM
ncbi:ubiquitin-specific protease ubp15, partial [Linderina pennispora]